MKSRREAARREIRLVTLDLNLTFMQTPAIKHGKLITEKRDQWQLSNHTFPRYYQSNEPIILICEFVKNTHQFEPDGQILNEGVVSKETVVLRRCGSSIQKFGFINGVDNVNWPPYRDSKS